MLTCFFFSCFRDDLGPRGPLVPSVKCPRRGSQSGDGPLNSVSLPEVGCQAAGLAASGCHKPCPPFIAAYSCGTQICAALDSHLSFLSPSLPTSAPAAGHWGLCQLISRWPEEEAPLVLCSGVKSEMTERAFCSVSVASWAGSFRLDRQEMDTHHFCC